MKRLIVQSIGPAPDQYQWTLDSIMPITQKYASMCGADYRIHYGKCDPSVHVSWNRVALILKAFEQGYEKVVWLDLDTLVVNINDSIFDGTDDTTPFHSTRLLHDGQGGEPPTVGDTRAYIENDGVLVVNNTPQAVEALEEFWSKRGLPKNGHEQGWYDDYLREHPRVYKCLPSKYNWFDWEGAIRERIVSSYPTREEASIVAWHAFNGPRHVAMRHELARCWG